MPDGALQHPPVCRCVRLHRLGEPKDRGHPGAGERPARLPRHGDGCGGGGHILSIGPLEAILELNRRLEPHKEKGDFLPFSRLMELFDQYPVLVGCGHPFRAPGHVPELPEEQLRRLKFLDLNGKDLALDRERTERLTCALGKSWASLWCPAATPTRRCSTAASPQSLNGRWTPSPPSMGR